MRLQTLLLSAAAAALIAAAAGAQDPAPPADPPAKADAAPAAGLSGLEDTVSTLEDRPAPEAPAEAAPTPAPARAPVSPPPARASAAAEPLTRAQREQLAAAVERGRLLFAIARASLLGTQDMLSRVSDPSGAGIVGWVAEPAGNSVAITFYAAGEGGGVPAAVYRATVLGSRVTERQVFLSGTRPALSPRLARMAAARSATDALDHRPCGAEDFNVLVVPPATPDGPIDVYQTSPATAAGRFPLGGHFKTTVAPDGSIAATRGFTNACLDLVVPPLAAGVQPRPLAITHLLDPLPTEIHVFLALWTGRPLIVVADDPQRLFAVTGDSVAEIPPGAGATTPGGR